MKKKTSTSRIQRALVLVPTYNEAKNIKKLLEKIFALEHASVGWDIHVLVRDDTSPDGTSDIVRELQLVYKNKLILSEGKKEGLGKAMQQAFDEIKKLNYDAVVTMDADFSHSPEDIPKLLEAISDGADVALGSRYIEGGLIPGNWPISLIIRTRVASMVARLLGGIDPSIRELTTNFRAMTMKTLKTINYNDVVANGYGFQIFLANAFTSHDFVVKEVPISFYSRAHGQSKAKFSDVLEFFKIAYKLNSDSPAKQVFRFLGVGASGTLINLGSLWLLQTYLDSNAIILSAVAIQLSIVWNFILHNKYTFKRYKKATRQDRTVKLYIQNFIKYEMASSLTQVIIFSSFVYFSNIGLFYLFAQAIGISLAFIVNYYLSATYIWALSRKYV